ncbi:MAG: hypothetical protein HYZ53_23475 [Planctomycetes bacterium]|nr:hypothetical protein [Planctomycetota bacterium]
MSPPTHETAAADAHTDGPDASAGRSYAISPARRRLFVLVLSAFWLVVFAVLGLLLHRKLHPSFPVTRNVTCRPRPLGQQDPALGWRVFPGDFEFEAAAVGADAPPLRVACRIDPDGHRVTSADPARYLGKPEVWIFGCSFSWGWLLPDEATFPWLLQERLPDCRVTNLAASGYGNLHALLQLRLLADQARPMPRVAVFAYCAFHQERNSFTPTWRGAFFGGSTVPHEQRDLLYPKGVLDEQGRLSVRMVHVFSGPAADAPREEQEAVTRAIFDELALLCNERHVRPVLAVQQASLEDPVVARCRERGFEVVDLNLDLTRPEYSLRPYDPSHPNAAAHLAYAERLLPAIERLR